MRSSGSQAGHEGGSTFVRPPGLGLVSFQVQRSQEEAAATQHDGKGTAQETVLQTEEALQVGVWAPSLQDAGDLPRGEVYLRGPPGDPRTLA